MIFDTLFQREYDYESYNCLHFTVEVWLALFDIDLSFLTQSIVQDGGMHSLIDMARLKTFRRLRRPASPSLCLMRGSIADQTHVATYLDGRILHINEIGVQYLPPEVVLPQYRKILFYEYFLPRRGECG